MNDYIVGVDIGGSSSRYVLYDSELNELSKIKTDSRHFKNIGFDAVGKSMYTDLKKLLEPKQLSFKEIDIYISMAGYGRDQQIRKKIDKSIHAFFHCKIVSDIIASFHTYFTKDGILASIGTGSYYIGKFEDKVVRYGGWGPILGDEFSGYDIGLKILNEFTKQSDGRHEKDRLYHMIMKHYKIKKEYEMVLLFEQMERDQIAMLSKFLNLECNSIEQLRIQMVNEIERNIRRVIEELQYKRPSIVVTGGVLVNNQEIVKDVEEKLGRKLVIGKMGIQLGAIKYFKQYL